MHRTTHRKPSLGKGLWLALLLAWPVDAARAQTSPGAALIVPINGTVRLQMTTKKPIKSVTNPKDTAISIRTLVGDPTTVLITGQGPDVTRVELVDEDGKKETYEIIVQLDVEYLKTQLRRVVPTANVTPIPTSNNSIVLAGTVAKAQDVDLIMRVAQSIGGVQVTNGMQVGGVQQVQLDVLVAQVSRSEFRRMAFNFLSDSRNTFFGSTIGQAVASPTTVGVASTQLTVNGILSGTPGAPNGAAANLIGGVLKNSWGFIFFLQALRDENLLKLMAEPRLVTLSGRPASFLAGGQQAIPVPAGLGQVGIQYQEFGTRLNFLPIVLGNGKIHLEVEPEVSDLNPANGTVIQGTAVPGLNTNRANTTVQLESGQTLVLAGLLQHRVRATAQKIPILGDIPFLNTAFSNKSFEEIEDELVIMITPHIIDAQSCDQVVKCLPGQETRSPDDFELFLEGILEAPRGPRQVFQGRNYVPAYKNGPTSDIFPCGNGGCGGNCAAGCSTGACGKGCATDYTPAPVMSEGIKRTEAAGNRPASPMTTPNPLTVPPGRLSKLPAANPSTKCEPSPLLSGPPAAQKTADSTVVPAELAASDAQKPRVPAPLNKATAGEWEQPEEEAPEKLLMPDKK